MSYLFSHHSFIIHFNCIYPNFLALVPDYSQRNLTPKTKILAAYCESTVIELPGPYSTLAQSRPMGCILGLVVSILPLTQRQSSLSRQITTPDSASLGGGFAKPLPFGLYGGGSSSYNDVAMLPSPELLRRWLESSPRCTSAVFLTGFPAR
jgi:hypothetical protein